MPLHLSLYLDAIRVLAAVVVFLGHFSQGWLGGGLFWQAQVHAHTAVLVFFVLSGYVIAFTADTKERTLNDYAVARLSRLLSVVLPALLLSAALLFAGEALNPAHYAELARRGHGHTQTSLIGQFFAGLFFLSESWALHVRVLSNTPYWSLAYEFWYYAIFGCIHFLRGRQRVIAATVACLIAGPKILLMAPIWIAGVAAWRWRHRVAPGAALTLAIGTALVIAVLISGPVRSISGGPGGVWWPMEFRYTDHLIGFSFALHIAAVGAITTKGIAIPHSLAKMMAKMIKGFASYTFSIYLFHFPLLVFLGAILPGQPDDPARWASLLITTSFAIFALAQISEKRRTLVKTTLGRILQAIAKRAQPERL